MNSGWVPVYGTVAESTRPAHQAQEHFTTTSSMIPIRVHDRETNKLYAVETRTRWTFQITPSLTFVLPFNLRHFTRPEHHPICICS